MKRKRRSSSEYITLASLRARGWTPAIVRSFLPQADATKPNPFYRCAAPMRLYALERVQAIERHDSWRAASTAALRRSVAAKQAAQKKSEQLVALARSVRIYVDVLKPRALLDAAVHHYEHRQHLRAVEYDTFKFDSVSPDAPAAFLDRIQVNFIRHQKTRYEDLLNSQFKKVGALKARSIITQRTFIAIARAYPWLQHECARQATHKRLGILSPQMELLPG